MSRHHTLPPIITTPPPPKPKPARRRRGVGYARGARAADEAADIEDGAPVRSTPVVPQHARPVETVERRAPSPNGKLSDDTLRAMLEVQEKQPG
ncbi:MULTISPECIES: hypothetical protein [Bradyrhizobium]|uniref:hypothetical protein n=1 Tax=Bradyrhizobium TaxID=374 RepID=UPI000488B108|nr:MULTISPECIES: hypothetical protein [Bradyrhizobium]MCS3453269.1 hypothetical protein [Bradyrhizobium elkanii]MCS3564623.1 hypothetical protein [Bradyrhizobium elkanii]MCW2145545.1 hypothetical protein [Bradyrhizobium elkanii]MCW2355637.1 hypothetical protein [Bradyrhizobium elkanii]MCW2378372.1 hypothetical protein [Bradyrhizobium elkanii]